MSPHLRHGADTRHKRLHPFSTKPSIRALRPVRWSTAEGCPGVLAPVPKYMYALNCALRVRARRLEKVLLTLWKS